MKEANQNKKWTKLQNTGSMKRKFEIIDGKCVIPHGVTDIDDREFYCTDALREVVLPETLRNIGRQAFKGCWNLTEICIPSSVIEIKEEAFAGCCGMESIKVEKGNPMFRSEGNCCLTEDGKTLVFGCKASVIPDSVESIGPSAFQWCETMSGIAIPASVINIENKAFYGCLALRDVVFSNSGNLRMIGDDAFSRCPSLRIVTIPEGVREIGRGAFAECMYLWAVKIPHSITCIKEGTFFRCESLSKFSLPNSIKEVQRYAFCECHNLEGLKIPASVTLVGSYAFSECGWREKIKIPDTVRLVGRNVSSCVTPRKKEEDDFTEK